MPDKTISFNKRSIAKLTDDKPTLYAIVRPSGK